MNRILIAITAAIGLSANAAVIRLAWDPNPPAEKVVQYILEFSRGDSGEWLEAPPVSVTEADVDLPPGVWRFRCTAVSEDGLKAKPCDPIASPDAPSKPANMTAGRVGLLATIRWDPNPDGEHVDHYLLSMRKTGSEEWLVEPVTDTTIERVLDDIGYDVKVEAVNVWGSGEPVVAQILGAPSIVTGLTIRGR